MSEEKSNNKFKLLLEINQNQFDELKYLIDLQLSKDTNLVRYNEDEQLISDLKGIRKQLSYPNLQDHPDVQP
jgi:hypothetical protein